MNDKLRNVPQIPPTLRAGVAVVGAAVCVLVVLLSLVSQYYFSATLYGAMGTICAWGAISLVREWDRLENERQLTSNANSFPINTEAHQDIQATIGLNKHVQAVDQIERVLERQIIAIRCQFCGNLTPAN